MKNRLHYLFAVILVAAMAIATTSTSTVKAQSTDAEDSRIATVSQNETSIDPLVVVPPSSETFMIGENNNFVEVARKNSGLNCNIQIVIRNWNNSRYQADVILNGRNGMIASHDNCIGGSSDGTGMREFWCGSNVTSVTLRIIPKNTLFPARPKAFVVVVTGR